MMQSNVTLKTGQVIVALGIKPKYLQNVVEAGYVRPSVAGTGRGSARLYSFEDVVRLQVFDILVNAYGLEQKYAARVLSAAWPKRLTKATRVLTIALRKGAVNKVSLEPIRIPLAEIVEATSEKIISVQQTYLEKKRGRPVGWSKQMRSALGTVSEHLQEVSDDDIRRTIAEVRSDRAKKKKAVKR